MKPVNIIQGLWPDQALPQYVLPAREEVTADFPDWVQQSPIMPWLRHEIRDHRLFSHQGLALDAYNKGDNVALMTGLDSGKSLIPQIAFLHGLMTDKHATYVVMLPFTALNRDQMMRWDEALKFLKLPPRWLVKIDGSMPEEYRLPAMKDARLLFVTPHSFHSWFMKNLQELPVRKFLTNMRGGFLDEVQEYEGIPGANMAMLMRRMITLHEIMKPKDEIRWIAASATLGSPKGFLRDLVSREFTVIGPDKDGSRQNQRTVLHLQSDKRMQSREEGIRAATEIAQKTPSGLTLYFIDSRDGVEDIARRLQAELGEDAVMAYSGKYTRGRSKGAGIDDFNERVRGKDLRVIVTTSALQAGVHLPNVSHVINDNIPLSIGAFRQRLGRSGRGDDESAILLIGDGARFDHFKADGKDGFTSYMEAPPERPSLMLGNRALLFIHAQVLLAETKMISHVGKVPNVVTWDPAAGEIFRLANRARSQLPLELQALKVPRTQSVHETFPFLNTGMRQARLALVNANTGRDQVLTDMPVDRAMEEAPPGGTYRYGGKYHFVKAWHWMSSRQMARAFWRIELVPSESGAVTRGIVERSVTANLHTGTVIRNHFLSQPGGPEQGFIAEMALPVQLKLTGLTGRFHTDEGIRGFRMQYRDLEREAEEAAAVAEGRAPAEKGAEKTVHQSKYFAQNIHKQSTGVVIHIPKVWFGHDARQVVARALMTSFTRDHGIDVFDPTRVADIGFETEHVKIQSDVGTVIEGGARHGGSIAIMDNVQYGLRLTAPVYERFRTYLEDAIREDEKMSEEDRQLLQRVLDWHAELVPLPLPSPQVFVQGEQLAPPPEGHALMFAVGSLVDLERDGVRTVRRVAGYKVQTNPDTQEKSLTYQLQSTFVGPSQSRPSVQFDHGGRMVTDRAKVVEGATDPTVTVSRDQVQAPLNHVRFAYAWVNLETLETMVPKVAENAAGPAAGASPEQRLG